MWVLELAGLDRDTLGYGEYRPSTFDRWDSGLNGMSLLIGDLAEKAAALPVGASVCQDWPAFVADARAFVDPDGPLWRASGRVVFVGWTTNIRVTLSDPDLPVHILSASTVAGLDGVPRHLTFCGEQYVYGERAHEYVVANYSSTGSTCVACRTDYDQRSGSRTDQRG
jgi:hypothetical protein